MKAKALETSLRIEAPAAQIFQILANPARHRDFDGSGMVGDSLTSEPVSKVGDSFTIKMHRLGDDYLIINHIVVFQTDRKIVWEPAPGDVSRSENHDPANIGIAAGYRWGYILEPDGENATLVTEIFDYSSLSDDLLRDDGSWINGHNPLIESMKRSLEKLASICQQA